MDWLGENLKLVSLGAGFLQQVRGGCLTGKQQDLAFRQHGANLNRRVDAIHIIHNDIANDHFRLHGLSQFNGGFPAVCGSRFKTVPIQDNDQRVRDNAFIVDHQYLWLHETSLAVLKNEWV
jgi:hypothetical protein